MTASTKALEAARERFFTAQGNKVPETEQQKSVAIINSLVVELAAYIDDLVPGGRNKSLAFTHLEDVSMRANRGLFATGPSA